jgi:hypothetical protein
MKLKIRNIEFISVMYNICWYENVLSFGMRSWDYLDRSRCERQDFQVDPSLTYRDACILYEYRTQIRIWGHKEFVWMWGSDQLSVKFWRRITAEMSNRLLTLSFAETESMSAECQHEPSVTTSDRFLLPTTWCGLYKSHHVAFENVITWRNII